MKILFTVLGKTLSICPERILRVLCLFIGWCLVSIPSKRKRSIHSNLYYSFESMGEKDRFSIALESSARTIEMGIFSLVSPFISLEDLKERITISEETRHELKNLNKKPTVLLVPHFSMMEAITMFPKLTDVDLPKVGVIYRPFKLKSLEDWVKSYREKFGIKLFSRYDGLHKAFRYLENDGIVAVLFDQNPGDRGRLTLFMDRLATTTEMASRFVDRYNASCGIFYAVRKGFWRAEICSKRLHSTTPEEIIFSSNQWLENILASDMNLCKDWLWLHNRWKYKSRDKTEFNTINNFTLLKENLEFLKLKEVPRKLNFVINLSDNLDEVKEFLLVLERLKSSRFDGKFILLCEKDHVDFIKVNSSGDEVIPRAEGFFDSIKLSISLRKIYPEIFVQFKRSLKSDFFAKIVGSRKTFTMDAKKRLFSTVTYINGSTQFSKKDYEEFFKNFGME